MKPITILDKDYLAWVQTLCERYRISQIRAAVKVNKEMLQYYWLLGKEITERGDENKYGSAFYATLSRDLRNRLPDLPPPVADLQSTENKSDDIAHLNLQQVVADLMNGIYQIPWGTIRS